MRERQLIPIQSDIHKLAVLILGKISRLSCYNRSRCRNQICIGALQLHYGFRGNFIETGSRFSLKRYDLPDLLRSRVKQHGGITGEFLQTSLTITIGIECGF